jgi:LacI family transcriptional regulator
MATIYEVSKRAGVSLATVSRVMNNSARVSDATRQKVLAAIAELDFRPNSIAQSLASNRSNSVGIMMPELHGPFFGTLVTGIERVLREGGKHAIVTVGHSDPDKERGGIEFLASRRCDAMILAVDAVSDEYLAALSLRPVPVAVVNRQVPGIASACISLDNRYGGKIATECLLEHGHRGIAYVGGPAWKVDAQERLAGHKDALSAAGIKFDEQLYYEGDYHEPSGAAGFAHFAERGASFSALVCANDGMAAGAMRAARERGLELPGDLSIMGFDNVNFSRYLYPKLSTIDYPADAVGAMAAQWVMKNVYGKDTLEIRNVFAPTLVMRESVRQRAR